MRKIFSYKNLNSATKRVYDYLYDEIVHNRLAPGTPLSELELSKLLNTSRSPVREATMVLESEGLIRRYPGRGCFVAHITAHDINEIFSLRILFETSALKESFSSLDLPSLHALEQNLQALTPENDSEDYFDTDRQLHDLIVGSCGNMRLILILRTLNTQIEQFRRISSQKPQRLKQSRLEHLGILKALIDQDVEKACKLLEEHIRNVQSSTLSVYINMGIGDTSPQ